MIRSSVKIDYPKIDKLSKIALWLPKYNVKSTTDHINQFEGHLRYFPHEGEQLDETEFKGSFKRATW